MSLSRGIKSIKMVSTGSKSMQTLKHYDLLEHDPQSLHVIVSMKPDASVV